MRLTITTITALILLTGCDGHYRYPCQDPANWGKLECNNEVCKAEGTCTSDVLAPAGTREFGLTNQSQSETESQTNDELSTESTETEISNSGCTPQQASYEEDTKRDFKVKHKIVDKEAIVMDPESDEYEAPVRTPPSMDEQPLTMNTVVDTAAHNAATK